MAINTLPRYVRVALDFARRILNGEVPLNEQIKGRTVLAAEYKVSSETIRKAMTLLENEGVVTVRTGVGIFVENMIKAENFVLQYKSDRSVRRLEADFDALLTQKIDAENRVNAALKELVDAFKYRTAESITFYEIQIRDGSKVIGQTIGQIRFWNQTGGTIVAIVHDDMITVSPGPDAVLYADDTLIVVGDNEVVARCETFLDEGIDARDMV